MRRRDRAAFTPLALAASAAVVIAAMVPQAAAAADAPAGSILPAGEYTVLDFDSEAPPWPAPPSIDGTAASVFDDDPTTQWGSWYQDGAPDPMPHWITFDTGAVRTMTGLAYR